MAWNGMEDDFFVFHIFVLICFIPYFRFAFKDFCFVMKITSFRNTYDLEPKHPRFIFNNSFNKHFPKLIFFKSILSRENWRPLGYVYGLIITEQVCSHINYKICHNQTSKQGRTQRGIWGFNPPPIGLSTKMHNKENITFLAFI